VLTTIPLPVEPLDRLYALAQLTIIPAPVFEQDIVSCCITSNTGGFGSDNTIVQLFTQQLGSLIFLI
jgi:hypothetical protein